MTAVLSFSGGQDSTTILYLALQSHARAHCVSFDYGQRHKRELDAAKDVLRIARRQYPLRTITHETVMVPRELLASDSPLTSDRPLETYDSPLHMQKVIGDRIEVTFIPGRNLVFAAMCAAIAARIKAEEIYLGVNIADNPNFPDCSEDFVRSMRTTIRLALGHNPPDLRTPLLQLYKKGIVQLAASLPGCYEALAYSHTAYSGEYPPVTQDHATVLRASGFDEAGLPDPLLVRAYSEGFLLDRPPHMPRECNNLVDVLAAFPAIKRMPSNG